jgi:hypothetical protein
MSGVPRKPLRRVSVGGGLAGAVSQILHAATEDEVATPTAAR